MRFVVIGMYVFKNLVVGNFSDSMEPRLGPPSPGLEVGDGIWSCGVRLGGARVEYSPLPGFKGDFYCPDCRREFHITRLDDFQDKDNRDKPR